MYSDPRLTEENMSEWKAEDQRRALERQRIAAAERRARAVQIKEKERRTEEEKRRKQREEEEMLRLQRQKEEEERERQRRELLMKKREVKRVSYCDGAEWWRKGVRREYHRVFKRQRRCSDRRGCWRRRSRKGTSSSQKR